MSTGISFMALAVIAAIVVAVLVAFAIVFVVVAVSARRSQPTNTNPDAAPCPKCDALVPLAKRDCPACGARVA